MYIYMFTPQTTVLGGVSIHIFCIYRHRRLYRDYILENHLDKKMQNQMPKACSLSETHKFESPGESYFAGSPQKRVTVVWV